MKFVIKWLGCKPFESLNSQEERDLVTLVEDVMVPDFSAQLISVDLKCSFEEANRILCQHRPLKRGMRDLGWIDSLIAKYWNKRLQDTSKKNIG